jgi:hypothetical protein
MNAVLLKGLEMPVSANNSNSNSVSTGFSRRYFSIPALVFMAVLCIFAPGFTFGQVVNATLQGTVQDATGAKISGAKVRALDNSTGIITRTQTNANGRFVFAALAPGGPYTITVEAPGFRAEDRSGIQLQVNQVVDISIPLQVGASAQRVEVNSDATQLETSSAAMGQVIGNRSVVDLPLNQRNVYSLMFLVPGVTGTVGNTYNSLNMSVNGGRPGTTEILVDGIPASPPLSQSYPGYCSFSFSGRRSRVQGRA